jgi:hypothetical protein
MKSVEIAVRAQARLGNDALGVSLMRTAFGKAGPLTDPAAEPGEKVAIMDLYAGSIGLFKNPSSHRYVDFDDATLGGEVITWPIFSSDYSISVFRVGSRHTESGACSNSRSRSAGEGTAALRVARCQPNSTTGRTSPWATWPSVP